MNSCWLRWSFHAVIAGLWQGTCETSDGQSAASDLDISEDKTGKLTGNWDGISLKGERVGRETFFFEIQNRTYSYRAIGVIDDGQLLLNYAATPKNGGARTYGWAKLSQAR